MIAICIMIINNITRPINQLSTFMEDVSYTTLKSNLPTTGANEIDQVIINVNSMLRQIEALTHKIFTNQGEYYEMELAKKNAEFFALQNQINPHFLYNTLDCIRSIAFSYNADEIVSISSSMSKIFRYCIKSENLVTVQDELACVNNYINIIQVRYDNRFNIEQDIDEGLLSEKIIKFLLQPLIENAIYHGLELKAGPGTLRIIGKKLKENEFEFEIYDTGVGIEPGALKELNQHLDDPDYIDDQNHTGVGLVNINWRIKNVFGEKYGLHIESLKNEWTKVTLLLSSLPENYH
jgi:two-component system sensor histidine kinase YesM